jgi:hypothetical protein
MLRKFQKSLILALFPLLLWVSLSACTPQPPSRFEPAQQESTERGATAVVKESTQGAKFNVFFPPAEGDYQRIYTQEKQGFAEAKLKRAGKEVAVLAISDVLNNPAAVEKFKTSSLAIAGYPAVQQGSMATALLVDGRYQVKVLSRDASFTAQDREQWLEKFNLSGLAALP